MYTIPKFDTDHIAFSFGVLSDWHIKQDAEPERDNREKLLSAIGQLYARAERDDGNGLSLLVAAGDLTHDGKPEEISLLRQTMDRVMDWDKTAFIYVAGNHDRHNPSCNEAYREVFGETTDGGYEQQSAAPDGMLSGNRHIVVKGRHFITLDPGKYHKQEPNVFNQSTKDWLDGTLAAITEAEPEAYVYVITHLLMQDTCYGSSRGFFYATDDVTEILKKYPQVVTFGGHLHYPLNDERAIMQTCFTAMETATLSDMLIDGFDCGNVRKTKTDGNRFFAQGLLVQQDTAGNLRVTRMDFWHGAEIGEPWYLDAPASDGAHLTRYTAQRAVVAEKPMLDGEISTAFERMENGTTRLILTLDAARYAGFVRAYTVTLTGDDGELICRYRHMTDFYRHPQYADMPRRVEIVIPDIAPGEYRVGITAHDCWDNVSNILTGVTA